MTTTLVTLLVVALCLLTWALVRQGRPRRSGPRTLKCELCGGLTDALYNLDSCPHQKICEACAFDFQVQDAFNDRMPDEAHLVVHTWLPMGNPEYEL